MIDPVQDRLHLGEQAFAGRGQRDAARGPIEEPNTQLLLERANGLTHRRRRDADLSRRLRETAVLRDRHKGRQFRKLDAGHYSLFGPA